MERYTLTKRISILGIVANILLLITKLTIGFISHSQAMIADGFNSAGDVFSSAMTYVGNKIASQPEDHNHPYGHGKAEYIFSMIISLSFLLVAYTIFQSSLNAVLNRETFVFSWWLVGIALSTIILKLGLFLYTRKIGKATDSLLILANSEDHRNDVFVSAATLLSIILGAQGIYWLDGIAGIGISAWIAYTGIQIFMSAFHVLMDTNINEKLKEDVVRTILTVDGVDHVDSVVAKPVGFQFIIIAKISVPGDLTIYQGHSIAARVKEKLKANKYISDVVVHVNPA
ncbi:MAG: cation diffusion facilitator family transporter [Firmicutes bacterium]|nr:cation diffusion facilitator family transporter [Bacillota bacterium]